MTPPVRYSPNPIEAYPAAAGSRLLDRLEVWNLAYLSHDFDKFPSPGDPNFFTHVRRTCQYDLTLGRLDLTFGAQGEPNLLADKLQMPAPQFVHWLRRHPKVMIKLPLFQIYGQAWLATIESRARLCQTHDHEPEEPLHDLSAASAVILQFRRR